MSRMQIIAIAMTIVLNALDGFDVLAISFASPGIAEEWGINRSALGIVLSMELIGMALGSVFLGGLADRIGRRKTTLGCLVGMSIGMYMATTVTGLVDLSIWRIITGLGIGGMLASVNAMVAMCIPLVYFLVPESVHWLAHKQPKGALEEINRTLKRMGHAAISALPAPEALSSGTLFYPAILDTAAKARIASGVLVL